MISVLLSFRLSFEIRAMHLDSSATRFFSAALMTLKFLTMLRFLSSSLSSMGISSESMLSMLMWSKRWLMDTSSFEISSIIT